MKIKKKKKETVGADGLERARSDSSLRRITASFAHLEEYGNVKQARENIRRVCENCRNTCGFLSRAG
jgi:hypothetical protein